jgi:hypothetical protein
MAEEVRFAGEQMRKDEAVASTINIFVDELIHRCRREEGVRDYFDIAVLEYGGRGVRSALSREEEFCTPSELMRMAVETERRHVLRLLPGGNQISTVIEQRKWITPRAEGSTPMGEALARAEKLLRTWCANPANRRSFPPMVINITDGEASDACHYRLCEAAERIKSLGTEDGNAILINIHLARGGSAEDGSAEVSFPCDPCRLPSHPYARLLWDMSSNMPERCNEAIGGTTGAGNPPYRAMSYNCAVDALFNTLTIGSISAAVMV